MFKKITAVIVATTMMVVGLTAMPANATVTSNAGAVSKTNWSLNYSSPAGVRSSTTSSITIPAGASSFDSYLELRFGNTYVSSLAGHDIVVDWNETFPSGVTWNSGTYDPNKPYKYLRGGGGGGYQPSWNEVNVVTNNTTAGEPADSSVFTVPNDVTSLTQNQYFSVTLGLSQDNNPLRTGTYTIAPTLYDRTAGAPITIASTEDASSSYVTSAWSWIDGQGAYAGNIPAGMLLTQSMTTCVLANRLVSGNVLTVDRLKDGTSVGPAQYGSSIYKKGTQNYVGSFNPNWTVSSSVATDNWAGIRTNSNIEVDNTAGSSAIPLPTLDIIVKDTSAGDAQLESTCAAQTPAKPTFTLNSTTSARITWAKNSEDTNVQYWDRKTTYKWSLFKQSDLTTPVMVRDVDMPTLANGTYTETIDFRDSMWNPLPVDLDTNYVIKLTASNQGDYIESPYSPASDPSMLQTPAAPSAPTLDLVNPTKFTITWNKIASDIERTGCGQPSCGRTVDYTYQLFKASDLNTIVSSGGMFGSTLTGNSYSKTFENVMSGPPTWQTVRLEGSVNYVVKIKAYDSTANLDSAWSVASAVDSLVGPPAPLKPTEPVATVTMVTAKLTMRAGETSHRYSIAVYNAADTTFSNPLTTSMNSSSSCSATAPGALTLTCTVSINNGMATFNAPTMYVIRAFSTDSNGLASLGSPASSEFMGGIPGVSVANPSNGTEAGDAKMWSENFPGIIGSSTRGQVLPDGRGNYYSLSFDTTSDASETFALRKLKADFTGFETGFGSGGKTTLTTLNQSSQYQGSGTPTINKVTMPSTSFFGESNKIAAFSSVSNCAPNPNMPGSMSCGSPSTVVNMSESTIGSAFSTPINITQKLMDFCTANADTDIATLTSANLTGLSGFTGFDRPVGQLTCSGYTNNNGYMNYAQAFLTSISSDGTPTLITTLNTIDTNETTVTRTSISGNPAATGTQVAAVMLVVRAKGSTGSYGTYSNYSRALIRVKADGTVVETPEAYSVVGTEPTVNLAPVNDGTTVYAVHSVNGVNKLLQTGVATGTFNSGSTITLDVQTNMAATTLTFPRNSVPNVDVNDSPDQGEKIAFIRTDNVMMTRQIGPMSYRLSDGATVTGERLVYSSSGTPLSYSDVNPAGNMVYLYTPAVSQVSLSHKVIRWLNVRSIVPTPVPAVSAPRVSVSLNAGGGNVVITGVNLGLTSATKKVKGVRFVTGLTTGTTVTTMTKTSTSITVKIPSASVAGVPVTPSSASPGYAEIKLILGDDTEVYAGDLIYVGAAKMPQPLTMTLSEAAATTASADRNISVQAGSISQNTDLAEAAPIGLPVLSATPASVCSIVEGKVRFLSNGNCLVKATKAGNEWLADGVDTKTIAVLKADSVTAGFSAGETPSEVMTADEAIAPVITLASGRTDYTMTAADEDICEINADTKMIWFKTGNEDCVVTIATPNATAVWSATTYTWTIPVLPPAGGAGSPLLVRNDNVMVKLPGLGVRWDQKKNQVFFVTRVKWVGPVQAKMSFVDDKGTEDEADDVTYTCVSNFGILKKSVLPKNNEPFIISSGAMCTDTKNESNLKQTAAEKTAQTAAYTAFKAVVARNTAAGASTDVQFTYRRETRRSSTYVQVGDALTTKTWSAPTYAKLYFRAIDTISAALPTGVVAAMSETADGAFNSIVTLESKRSDYTMVSTDNTKCEVLPDGRIWAKISGQNCVVTIGTGTNAIWAGKSYNWTIPMVASVAASSNSAIIAPSNNTPVNAGPLTVTWNQATSAVTVRMNSRSAGLVRVRMQFTDGTNTLRTCVQSFGAKKLSGAIDSIKAQSSKTFCAGAELTAFKALVAAKKTASAVIPVTFSFQFEQYNPLTGVLLTGQVANSDTKPWSTNFHVKLNYRATTN